MIMSADDAMMEFFISNFTTKLRSPSAGPCPLKAKPRESSGAIRTIASVKSTLHTTFKVQCRYEQSCLIKILSHTGGDDGGRGDKHGYVLVRNDNCSR